VGGGWGVPRGGTSPISPEGIHPKKKKSFLRRPTLNCVWKREETGKFTRNFAKYYFEGGGGGENKKKKTRKKQKKRKEKKKEEKERKKPPHNPNKKRQKRTSSKKRHNERRCLARKGKRNM